MRVVGYYVRDFCQSLCYMGGPYLVGYLGQAYWAVGGMSCMSPLFLYMYDCSMFPCVWEVQSMFYFVH